MFAGVHRSPRRSGGRRRLTPLAPWSPGGDGCLGHASPLPQVPYSVAGAFRASPPVHFGSQIHPADPLALVRMRHGSLTEIRSARD